MRGQLVRRCGAVVAALVLPVLLIGPASAASSSSKLASATLNGSGSTFQYAFIQVNQGGFKQAQPSITVNYNPVGSGQGRTDFVNKVTDIGASDAPYKTTDPQPPAPFMYFPTVVAPITVSFNVPGVKKLNLSADTIAKIFNTTITTWNDATIKAENPTAKLPSTKITVVHRTDGSGTTANFTNFLVKAAPTSWSLGTGSTVAWPSSTTGATGSTGVANLVNTTEGAVGYIDLSDADATGLTFASVKNASGKFVAPTLAGAAAAAQGATVNADLTFDPINATGPLAYAITSPTWLMVYTTQTDKAKGNAIKGFLDYIYGDGQKLASSVDYSPLPKALLKQAKAQVSKIVVRAS